MAASRTSLRADALTDERVVQLQKLNDMALARGQTLAQLALNWALRPAGVDALIVGARNPAQLLDTLGSLNAPELIPEELAALETLLTSV